MARPAPVGAGAIDQAGEARSPAIESLRAVAALAVLEGHVFGATRGYGPGAYASFFDRALLGGGFGVYLFFALTGYLLCRPFARRDLAGGRPLRLGRYAANRAVRILPLYYVVLIVYLVAFGHAGSPGMWWRYGLFVENLFPHLPPVDGPMWSLVVEVQFYALLPLLALGLAKVARGSARRAAVAIALVGLGASLVRLTLVTLPHGPDPRWVYSLPGTFVFFTSGLLLAVVDTAWRGRRPAGLRGPLARADLWLGLAAAIMLVVFWRYDLDALVVPATFLAVGAVALPLEAGPVTRALRWRPLAFLGVCSYSLYLWHFPIVNQVVGSAWAPHGFWALLALLVPLCGAVAVASYLSIERPFLRLRRNWGALAGRRDDPVAAANAP